MLSLFSRKYSAVAPAYRRKPFYGAAEQQLHARLLGELPRCHAHCHVFPRIALSALIAPPCDDPRQLRALQVPLQKRRVDYAIFDAAFNLVLVIELAAGEETPEDAASAALRSAGVKCIRWSLQRPPSAEQIRRCLAPYSSRGDSAVLSPPRDDGAGLAVAALDELARSGHLKTAYPHIWERICLFRHDPVHLEKYLSALSIQDRDDKRGGLEPGAIIDIGAIQAANRRLLPASAEATWNTPSMLR